MTPEMPNFRPETLQDQLALEEDGDGEEGEDGEWSSDPERRRQWLLGTVQKRLTDHVEAIRRDLNRIPETCQRALRRGDHVFEFARIPTIVPPDVRAEVEAILTELEQLIYEKGLRWNPKLLTAREHNQIGSTVWRRYAERDPDVPIPLLDAQFVAEGTREPETDPRNVLTLEEIDIARRLIGLTRLDRATGRVTDEVDQAAAADPYHFLTAERREVVQAQEEELTQRLSLIVLQAADRARRLFTVIDDLEQHLRGEITTPDLRERWAELQRLVAEKQSLNLEAGIQRAHQLAFELGSRDSLLTPQEILLRVGGYVDPKYLTQPYQPLALQDRTLQTEEVLARRAAEQAMVVTTSILGYERPLGFRLEELDADGETRCSPTIVDHEGSWDRDIGEQLKEFFTAKSTFPFARPGEWYYQGS